MASRDVENIENNVENPQIRKMLAPNLTLGGTCLLGIVLPLRCHFVHFRKATATLPNRPSKCCLFGRSLLARLC